ncbi:MAG TPA: ABC transporter permease [Fimbriimonas sp.]|nr:ABC transporter permease [Fimbriimonas sp.]
MSKRLPPWGWALVALIVLLIGNALFTPGFAHIEVRDGRLFGSVIDIGNRASPTLLLSLGMTLVIGSGGVDLSVGAVMAIAGTFAACLLERPTDSLLSRINVQKSVPAIVTLSLFASLVCGAFNGLLVSVFELQPIVATLLLMVAGRGIAQLLSDGQIITFTNPGFAHLGTGHLLGLPMPIWIFLIAWLLVGTLARRTALGLFVEAAGSNSVAAAYSGVNVRAVKMAVYCISGICAGMAGLITAADIQAADANNAGLYLELDAILAVSVGGTSLMGGRFSLIGTVIGALLMQTVTTTILTRGIAPEIALIVKAVIVVVVCVMQSTVVQQRFTRRAKA